MRIKTTVFALLILFVATSCYTSKEDVFVEDLDLVVVDYDDEFDFTQPRTFFMPDSINRPNERPDDNDDDTGQYDDLILDEIRANMVAKGFLEVGDSNVQDADVVLLIQSVRTNTYVIADPCFYGCWGWYPWPPGWGWGPGWGWPYPPTVVGSYSKGTIIMNMINPETPQDEMELDQVWQGAVNGLMQGSDESILRRINSLIDKAFELSPYLQR
jgi:hypothetical protein